MLLTQRLTGLAGLLAICEQAVDGKKRLQKLVFLAQHLGFPLDYDYIYHNFGVFSPELESDLRMAEHIGMVSQDPTGYAAEVAVKLLRPAGEVSFPNSKKDLLRILVKEEPRTLEVLSTIIFLREQGYKGDLLKKELERLKGHLPKPNHTRAWELLSTHFN